MYATCRICSAVMTSNSPLSPARQSHWVMGRTQPESGAQDVCGPLALISGCDHGALSTATSRSVHRQSDLNDGISDSLDSCSNVFQALSVFRVGEPIRDLFKSIVGGSQPRSWNFSTACRRNTKKLLWGWGFPLTALHDQLAK